MTAPYARFFTPFFLPAQPRRNTMNIFFGKVCACTHPAQDSILRCTRLPRHAFDGSFSSPVDNSSIPSVFSRSRLPSSSTSLQRRSFLFKASISARPPHKYFRLCTPSFAAFVSAKRLNWSMSAGLKFVGPEEVRKSVVRSSSLFNRTR